MGTWDYPFHLEYFFIEYSFQLLNILSNYLQHMENITGITKQGQSAPCIHIYIMFQTLRPFLFHLPYLQVFYMLKKSDPELIKQFVSRRELLFLSCLPVTPNCHRVVEIGYGLPDGRLTFVSTMFFGDSCYPFIVFPAIHN